MFTRLGTCQNCGDCCILFVNGKYQRCGHYDVTAKLHCTIHSQRPKACRNFPRGPMDLETKRDCGFYFTDEKGWRVDGDMDKRVSLQLVGKAS